MSYNPAYINFDANPFDEEAAIAAVRGDVANRINEDLAPITAGGPVITRPPQDVRGEDGETATFTVTAIGAGTLTFAWQVLNGGTWVATGDTDSSMSVSITPALDGAQYRCVVTDGNGVQTASQSATLTVISTTQQEA